MDRSEWDVVLLRHFANVLAEIVAVGHKSTIPSTQNRLERPYFEPTDGCEAFISKHRGKATHRVRHDSRSMSVVCIGECPSHLER